MFDVYKTFSKMPLDVCTHCLLRRGEVNLRGEHGWDHEEMLKRPVDVLGHLCVPTQR